jgi:hypothetical protein
MINGNVNEFIDQLFYEDHYVIFHGDKYFFNGCQCTFDETGKIINVLLEIYNLTKNSVIFSVEKKTQNLCIEAFEDAKIWGGKSFWDVENEMEWVDE